ncbi:class I SAM-dependent methyltransferase [Chloroflexus sp.]|uniref:class I SAM-dependent methyltransferase n=1 Tax=Chloroflexus sp. TaxID=1904827 RepID=UPI002ADD8B6C|nr:class I SAM-dependent methyltransferase [Chloroflexus sp.]
MITRLHEPYLVLLQQAMLAATPPGSRVALDLGCGDGSKTRWLRACSASDALIVGVDRDGSVLRAADDIMFIAGDASHLPLRDACIDLVWCIAALNLFPNRHLALREMWRVLRQGGTLVVATAGEYWVRLRNHPAPLIAALPDTPLPLPPADGLDEEWSLLMAAAGFQPRQTQAYLLDGGRLAQVALIDGEALTSHLSLPSYASLVADPEPRHLLVVTSARKV